MNTNSIWLYPAKTHSRKIFILALIVVLVIFATNAGAQSTTNSTAILDSTQKPVILILGDSLSSAFGFDQSKGWVALLQQKIAHNDYNFRIVNASISGETTQGGVQRLPKLLAKHEPKIVIIELGGNDGLRGLSLGQIEKNLNRMIDITLEANASAILTGIRLPPNYGQLYTRSFYKLYETLSARHRLPLIPFLLENVATNKQLMQDDGIHPKVDAQGIILKNVWKIIEPVLNNQN